jgi:hypothetical protein
MMAGFELSAGVIERKLEHRGPRGNKVIVFASFLAEFTTRLDDTPACCRTRSSAGCADFTSGPGVQSAVLIGKLQIITATCAVQTP